MNVQGWGATPWYTCLFWRRYWAFWIWSCVPVMVMMRSSEPSSGSSILIDAPDSWRICLILWPPLPMMEPASCKTSTRAEGTSIQGWRLSASHYLRLKRCLTSFGMVTCVVMTGPPISLYEPLLPAGGGMQEHLDETVFNDSTPQQGTFP